MSSVILFGLAPLILLAGGGLMFARPPSRGGQSLRVVENAALAALSLCVVGAAIVMGQGPQTSALLGFADLGFSIQLDAVSLTMALLVSFIGWVVSRYARTYMDGETSQAAFMGWLGVALGSVLLLVMAF